MKNTNSIHLLQIDFCSPDVLLAIEKSPSQRNLHKLAVKFPIK